jgi:hypothetical protein
MCTSLCTYGIYAHQPTTQLVLVPWYTRIVVCIVRTTARTSRMSRPYTRTTRHCQACTSPRESVWTSMLHIAKRESLDVYVCMSVCLYVRVYSLHVETTLHCSLHVESDTSARHASALLPIDHAATHLRSHLRGLTTHVERLTPASSSPPSPPASLLPASIRAHATNFPSSIEISPSSPFIPHHSPSPLPIILHLPSPLQRDRCTPIHSTHLRPGDGAECK